MAYDFEKELNSTQAPPPASSFDFGAELGVSQGGFIPAAKQLVGRGIKGVGQLATDFAGAAPDNAVRQYGQEVIDANPTAIGGLRDIVDKPGKFVSEALGNAVPSVGAAVGLRALGAGITAAAPFTGPAAPVVAGIGQLTSWAGPTIAMALPSYSGIRDTQGEGKNALKDKLAALGGAAAVGAIEQYGGPERLATQLITKAGRDTLAEAAVGQTLKQVVAKGATKGAVAEGITEGIQNPIEQIAGYQDPLTKQSLEETAVGSLMGAVGGGVFGGGMSAMVDRTRPDPKTDSGQSQLLSKLTGQDVTVTGGTATYTSPDGESFNVPVASLADHFATGGTLDTLDSATVTAPKLEALKGTLSYQEIADLRNSDELLREQGVSRRDVDNLLLSQVREVPGAEPLVRSMLETGTVDAQLIDRIKSGEFEPDPMGDEWARQTELARVNNIASLKRLNETEQRAAADAAVRDYENFDLTVPGQGQLPGDQGAAAEVAPQQTPQQTAIAEAVAQLNTPEDLNAYGNSVWEQVGQRQDLTDQQVSDLLKDVDEAVIRRIAELQTPQQTAAPAGTPPAGSPPPSLSDTSPTGAAPLQAEQAAQPLWRQAGLDTKAPIALDQVQAKKQTDGSYKLVYRGTENEIFTGQTFKSAPEARAVFKREQTLAQQTANAPDTLFAANDSQTQNNETQTPLSRTGEAQTEPLLTALKSFIGERAVDNLIRKGKVEIVSDVSQVPNTAKLDARQRKSVLGAYNSGQGKVFLVAGNLNPARVPEIMRHEVVHALLREDSRFVLRREGILKSFNALAKNNASVQAALAKVPAGTAESVRLEEGLAYWVQQESNHKHSLFKRIISAVKSGLARLGIPVGKYSTTDLSRMFTGGMEAWVNQGQESTGKDEGSLFAAREAAKAFFSKLMQVGATKFEGMKAQSVEPFLLKQGVKKSEIEATGLREWLASKKPTDKVTKGELADFVKANTVEFEDVVLGSKLEDKLTNQESRDLRDKLTALDFLGFEHYPEVRQAILRHEDWATRWDVEGDAELVRLGNKYRDIQLGKLNNVTHFDTYTEPGAKEGSYREMFVTAPKQGDKAVDYSEYDSLPTGDGSRFGIWKGEKFIGYTEEPGVEGIKEALDFFEQAPNTWSDGHSQYSDIKNPIVRIRFNEVAGPNGERILRIEEMQGPSSDNQTKMPKHLKENIYQTGVKRILVYAKENGFDGVALATKPGRTAGETQSDRYDLSVEYDSVVYSPEAKNDRFPGVVRAYPKGADRSRMIAKKVSSATELESLIGKELTDRVISEKIKRGKDYLEFKGIDLRVGGEGLKQLYDNDLPNIFKAWGGERMGETSTAGNSEETYKVMFDRSASAGRQYSLQLRGTPDTISRHATEEEAWDEADRLTPESTMPYIPITAKTADSFPMFALDNKPNTLFAMANTSLGNAEKSLTQKIKDFAEDKTLDNAPRWLSIAPLHTLVQTLGKKIPQIKQLSRHLEESEYISNDLINQAMEYRKRAEAFTPVVKEALNQAAFKATSYQMSPAKPMLEQDWIPTDKVTKEDKLKGAQMRWKASGMDKATGETFISAYTKAKNAYAAINDKDAKVVYDSMVAFMQGIRTREKNNLLAYIEQSTTGNKEAKALVRSFVGTSMPAEQLNAALKGSESEYQSLKAYAKENNADKEVLKAIVDAKDNPSLHAQLMLRADATFKNLKGDYWPLNRIGDYKLSFTDIDGVQVVKHYENANALRADKEMYIKNGVAPNTFKESRVDRRPRGEVAIPTELMQQLSASVYTQKLAEVDPADNNAVAEARAQAQDVVDEMNQIWLRWQPETSSLKSTIQRKTVRGADEDMLRSSLDYTRKHASNIAWSEQGRKIEGTLKSLADNIATERNQGVNVTSKGMVLTEMRNRLQAIRDAKTGPIASTIGKLGTAWYMTSPSIALVQMTQLPILTFPKLAVKYKSISKAFSAMKNGTQAAFSKDFSKKEIFGDDVVNTLHEQLRETVTEENRVSPDAKLKARTEGKMLGERLYDDDYIEAQFNKLKPKQQKLFVLREALARNLLDISAAHEAYALTQGKNPNGIVNKAFNLAMQPMKISEMASRKAAILATMELAQGQGKSFKRIMNNVSEVVNDTLYSYSKANKPAVLQGGTARVLAMFQWYRIMTVLRMGMLAKQSFAAETPEIKAAARKEFIGIMGMTTMLAGTLGLPLMKQVFAALDALADDDEPRDSELEFRKWAEENLGAAWGDVFTHGLPTLAGINISKRIGLGDLYGSQSQPPPRLHGKELAAWWAANQLGPAFGIVQGGFQGYDLMSKGEYLKGLEAALPKPLKDGLRAARVMQEGDVKSLTGRRTLAESEMTADAIPLLALGLNPAEIAQASKEGMSRSRISTAISERRGRVIDVMVQALEGDGDLEKARETLVTYNKKLPRFAIRGGDIRSALIRKMKEDRGIESRRDQLISSQYGL